MSILPILLIFKNFVDFYQFWQFYRFRRFLSFCQFSLFCRFIIIIADFQYYNFHYFRQCRFCLSRMFINMFWLYRQLLLSLSFGSLIMNLTSGVALALRSLGSIPQKILQCMENLDCFEKRVSVMTNACNLDGAVIRRSIASLGTQT